MITLKDRLNLKERLFLITFLLLVVLFFIFNIPRGMEKSFTSEFDTKKDRPMVVSLP